MADIDAEQRVVVVGAGQAGFAAAAKLRSLGHTGPLTMVGSEPYLPYQRPPLSKGYVLGETTRERLFLRPEDFYEQQNIVVRLSDHAERLDRTAKVVTLSSGEEIGYDRLILCTGAAPVVLPQAVTGGLQGVFYMRDLADADAIAKAMQPGKRVLVVGGGYIGLEGAAVANKMGMEVTLVEAGARILNRVASAETAEYLRALHKDRGVGLRENIGLSELQGQSGQVTHAVLSDGSTLECDLVLVGIGVRPNTQLAEAAGLALDNGIKTDSQARTSDPVIFAAGDCASFPLNGSQIRLESVGNAIDQAELAASNMLGQGDDYIAKPWFWSDQYDVKLQIAGLSTGYDQIITRRTDEKSVSFWYFVDQRLIAVDALNDPRSYMIAKRLIEAGKSPNPDLISVMGTDLKSLLKA